MASRIYSNRAHPDARSLICLIHDPDTHREPRGIESDLAPLSDETLRIMAVFG